MVGEANAQRVSIGYSGNRKKLDSINVFYSA